ncbi:uncharacterized protein B0H18DRAFT_1116598 [Fomitopsis serialis]|uniref:uncharacterized protein n=1 Tax=Fomitopsis serialis TaxID=139415 RepID=UPI002007FD82|nr:uncharacterized protein B0H18DRAFT_1116598 [Neoantrodia serialis]KAH9930891.1 hypothetical protein B0H18DRAFT_1116598 [Neoantrodia serialis]
MGHRRALEDYDIIWHILQLFGPHTERDLVDANSNSWADVGIAVDKDWATLACCARVSKAFSEPALRTLWRELPSPLPLFSLCLTLTRDVFDMPESKRPMIVWKSNEAPRPQGLRRFARFAALVQRIRIRHRESFDSNVFALLFQANPGHPLLPMIKEIKCRPLVSPFFDTNVLCLAGESLRSLAIYEDTRSGSKEANTHEPHALRRILLELPSKAPWLQDLRIYDQACRRVHDLSLAIDIGRFHELRTLVVGAVPLEELWFGPLMAMLAPLQHLCELDLPLGQWAEDIPSAVGCFPQLRKLRLHGHVRCRGMQCLGPLAKMAPIRLECLEVADAVVDSFTGDYGAFGDFAAACAGTLTEVTLSLGETLGGLDPTSASNLLRPFVQLRHLQLCNICLSGPDSLSFTDDDLRGIRGRGRS